MPGALHCLFKNSHFSHVNISVKNENVYYAMPLWKRILGLQKRKESITLHFHISEDHMKITVSPQRYKINNKKYHRKVCKNDRKEKR